MRSSSSICMTQASAWAGSPELPSGRVQVRMPARRLMRLPRRQRPSLSEKLIPRSVTGLRYPTRSGSHSGALPAHARSPAISQVAVGRVPERRMTSMWAGTGLACSTFGWSARPGVTKRLTAWLATDAGVVNLVILSAVAERPHGDAVQFDLTSTSANRVLQHLRDLGLDRDSSVMVEPVTAALADPAGHTERRRYFHGEHAPVWELVHARIREDANYAPSFFGLLVFAGLIGACGILTNSQILIVGAMVVSPEYSAIISVALGLDRREWPPVGRGLLALTAGFVLAIAVTLLFGLFIKATGRTPGLYLHGVRPVSNLINSPNLFSVVVAVIAGLVGVVSLTLARASALIGVFISVTTIPAAADIGVSIAYASWGEAGGSALQLLLNVGLLIRGRRGGAARAATAVAHLAAARRADLSCPRDVRTARRSTCALR